MSTGIKISLTRLTNDTSVRVTDVLTHTAVYSNTFTFCIQIFAKNNNNNILLGQRNVIMCRERLQTGMQLRGK